MKTRYNQHIESLFSSNRTTRIFGPAGTGKTTYLINELKKLFKAGVNPERIAFVSFTNKAVDEIVARAGKEFSHLDSSSFKYFRTIHSLCYRTMDRSKKVIEHKELSAFAKEQGLEVSTYKSIEDGAGAKKGDKVLAIEALAKLRMCSLKQQWEDSNFPELSFYHVQDWDKNYNAYKADNNLIDFTDMLSNFDYQIEADYVFIDECQDLSPLQWDVMSKAAEKAKQVYIAGDDDQSIYSWAGAEIDYILNIPVEEEVTLPKSYRLPRSIHKVAGKILKKIQVRKEKEYTHNGKQGVVDYVFDFKSIDFVSQDDCLVLCRNRWQLKEIKNHLEEIGCPYNMLGKNSLDMPEIRAIIYWENLRKGVEIPPAQFRVMSKFSKKLKRCISMSQIDSDLFKLPWFDVMDLMEPSKKDYIRRVLQNQFKIKELPKVSITTIHQSKGGEADTVVLFTDVSNMVWENIWMDSEHRVWYVAVTRAKRNLKIVQEQSNKFYKI